MLPKITIQDGVDDATSKSAANYFTSGSSLPSKVPAIITNLLFVAYALLAAFLASFAYVFEFALCSDEIASLYLMTEVTK